MELVNFRNNICLWSYIWLGIRGADDTSALNWLDDVRRGGPGPQWAVILGIDWMLPWYDSCRRERFFRPIYGIRSNLGS